MSLVSRNRLNVIISKKLLNYELFLNAFLLIDITNDELVAQCSLFFLAGYDTTATTLTMASYLLATNPDKQEKLYKEALSVLGKLSEEAGPDGSKDPVDLITLESLSRFEYLAAVVNETLRLYSPATFVEREVSKDMTIQKEDGSCKIHLKKNDIIQFPVYSMHRDPEQFSDPESFKPERFLGEPNFHKYAYIPFGSGPRNCIARSLALLEAKMALLHTIRQYKLSVSSKTKVYHDSYINNLCLSLTHSFSFIDRYHQIFIFKVK